MWLADNNNSALDLPQEYYFFHLEKCAIFTIFFVTRELKTRFLYTSFKYSEMSSFVSCANVAGANYKKIPFWFLLSFSLVLFFCYLHFFLPPVPQNVFVLHTHCI